MREIKPKLSVIKEFSPGKRAADNKSTSISHVIVDDQPSKTEMRQSPMTNLNSRVSPILSEYNKEGVPSSILPSKIVGAVGSMNL